MAGSLHGCAGFPKCRVRVSSTRTTRTDSWPLHVRIPLIIGTFWGLLDQAANARGAPRMPLESKTTTSYGPIKNEGFSEILSGWSSRPAAASGGAASARRRVSRRSCWRGRHTETPLQREPRAEHGQGCDNLLPLRFTT